MKYTKEKLIEEEKSGKKIEYVGFWGNKKDGVKERTFSNFYKLQTGIEIHDGRVINFECNEQYFMYRKALEFKDYETLEKILGSGLSAKDYKALGRAVKGYDDEVWDKVRYGAMLDGLRHKFSKNIKLKRYLLGTGEKVLVETSPYDRIWGIGIGKGNEDWKDSNKWLGLNLLGFALMEIRDELKESE